jgi:cytochrome c biogenesis protein CcmG, thiol:disulfide interchange protein DsbE
VRKTVATRHAYHFGVRVVKRRNLVIAGLSVAVAAIVAFGALHQSTPDEKAGLTPGFKTYTPPALTGTTLSGARFDLADLHGKPTFLNFWQSYCGPCQNEAPQLTSFSKALHGRANLIGVDVQDTRHAALSFVHKYDWGYPQLPVSDITLVERFGVIGFPTTLILNGRGQVIDKITGETTARALALKLAAVDKLAPSS